MKTLHLVRDIHVDASGTYGRLLLGSAPIACTIEPPWLDNAVSKSCIPVGEYVATRFVSRRFGETFSVRVPGRSGILFHAGNRVRETRGCILLVSSLWFPPGDVYGDFSRRKMAKFMRLLDGVKSFRLCVAMGPL